CDAHNFAAKCSTRNKVELFDNDAHRCSALIREAIRGDTLRKRLCQIDMTLGNSRFDAVNDEVIGDNAAEIARPVGPWMDRKLDGEANPLRYTLLLAPRADPHRQHDIADPHFIVRPRQVGHSVLLTHRRRIWKPGFCSAASTLAGIMLEA